MATENYNLTERTARFGEAAIEAALQFSRNPVTGSLISQFVRAATSIGASYSEADEAESKPDFRHKIAICKKEAKETRFWCRMLAKALGAGTDGLPDITQEAMKLHLIFCKIIRTTDANLALERQRK